MLALAPLASPPALAQTLPVTVGQDYVAAVAALKAAGVAYQEEATTGAGKKIAYTSGAETVSLEFALWPKDPAAPASAWEKASPEGKHLVLTQIRDVAPGSDARRAWVRGLEKDGHWAYLSSEADAARPAADRTKYPVAAFAQWTSPKATLLFEAARAPGTPPGSEKTELSISLDNPHKPRRF